MPQTVKDNFRQVILSDHRIKQTRNYLSFHGSAVWKRKNNVVIVILTTKIPFLFFLLFLPINKHTGYCFRKPYTTDTRLCLWFLKHENSTVADQYGRKDFQHIFC